MKIFVLGCTGMLGRYVYTHLKFQGYDVLGLSRAHLDAFRVSEEGLNLFDFNSGDVIINCIGIIKQREDISKLEFIKVNSVFPHMVANVCEKIGCNFIHVTSDCTYNGLVGGYNELHEHTARDVYGITKSLGEPENATVIRTSIIGEEIEQSRSLLEWVKSNKNKEVKGYTNHFWNGITCLQFAKVCEDIVRNGVYWRGVKHVISPSNVSKYELVKMISGIYDLNVKVVPYETEIKCDRTLTSIRNGVSLKIPELKEQLLEMRNFYNILRKELQHEKENVWKVSKLVTGH